MCLLFYLMLSLFAAVRCVLVIGSTRDVAIIGVALRLVATQRLAKDLVVIRLARLLGDLI